MGEKISLKVLFRVVVITNILCLVSISLVEARLSFACDPRNGLTRRLRFCRVDLPVHVRVRDLLGRLTLEEKIRLLVNNAAAVPRLGIQGYEWWSEALHGVSNVGPGTKFGGAFPAATSFPQVITTAASFNESLWEQIGRVVSDEARAMYNGGMAGLTYWSPNVNIFRDPRWGRGQETPGEDPVLAGKYAASYVRGLQSATGNRLKVAACCKHYTAYDLDNWNGVDRYHFNARVSKQDLVDTYDVPFKACVVEGKVASVMCSYNQVNGKPTCADPDLLKGTIRGQWGLNGYIVSDCDSVGVMYDTQHFTATPEESAAASIKAGLDLDCGPFLAVHTDLAVRRGLLAEADVDMALANTITVQMRLGMFDGEPSGQPYGNLGPRDVCTPSHKQLALEAARQGIVLLKNSGPSLPLSTSRHRTVAVIGPNSDVTVTMIGNYAGVACGYTSPLQDISRYARTIHQAGCSDVACKANNLFGAAEAAARQADATVLVMGLDQSINLGGIFCSEKNKLEGKTVQDVSKAVPSPKEPAVNPLQVKSVAFPECSIDYQDYTPCTDPRRWKKYGLHRLTFLERHCPPVFERKECLVPPPDGYKPPIRWPKSRDECWYRNVPYDWINKQKSNQNWLRKQGEKFLFPGGGTMFPKGVGAYVDLMQDLIPEMRDGTVRTAIDTGCGVASWGGDLLDRGILTVSLAPRDNHEAQVQFALERGIPAILGVISTQRLPFPSNSFDMAHCSRCLIPWTEFGGIYLLEVHRILRPGGFWVLSGPPVNYENRWRGWNTTVEEQKSDYEKLQDLLTSMCFKMYATKDDIAVWQKSSDNSCYDKLADPDVYPGKCDDSIEPDLAWYTPLRPCVVVPRPKLKKSSLESLPKWPERLQVAPERISDVPGGSGNALKHDDSKWKVRAKHYKNLLPAIGTDKIRNVMDMNTVYGGFATSLIDDPLWVMNVVSSYAANSLPVVYDRGLIGTYHDWCEAFSTYPRTYDLLHLDGLFTAESHRCDMKYVLLEMDRILRPNGYALIRESSYFVDAIATIAKGLRWGCRKEDTEYGVEKEKILVCQKKLWYSSSSS